MRSASLTEDPPYFWTTSATGASSHPGNVHVAMLEFTGAFPRTPASPHRGPSGLIGGSVRMSARHTAGHGLAVARVVDRELPQQRRLLVEVHEAGRHREEHRPIDEQHRLPQQESLAD